MVSTSWAPLVHDSPRLLLPLCKKQKLHDHDNNGADGDDDYDLMQDLIPFTSFEERTELQILKNQLFKLEQLSRRLVKVIQYQKWRLRKMKMRCVMSAHVH